MVLLRIAYLKFVAKGNIEFEQQERVMLLLPFGFGGIHIVRKIFRSDKKYEICLYALHYKLVDLFYYYKQNLKL